MVLRATNSVASMTVIIILGYMLAGTKAFKENHAAVLITKYLSRVALPVYMSYNMISVFSSRKELFETFKLMPIPCLLVLGGVMLGRLLAKICGVRFGRRGVFANACGLGNIVFIGFPLAQYILGPIGQGYNITYYIVNTTLFWVVGTFELRKDYDKEIRFFELSNLKKILSPPMCGFIFGIILVIAGVRVPAFIEMSMEKIAGTSSPLGMIFIGSVIREATWKNQGYVRDALILIFYKFFIAPLIMIMILTLLLLPQIAKQSFYILSLMPGMTQLGLMSREYKSDYAFAATWVALSTILCAIMIPIQVWCMTFLLE